MGTPDVDDDTDPLGAVSNADDITWWKNETIHLDGFESEGTAA